MYSWLQPLSRSWMFCFCETVPLLLLTFGLCTCVSYIDPHLRWILNRNFLFTFVCFTQSLPKCSFHVAAITCHKDLMAVTRTLWDLRVRNKRSYWTVMEHLQILEYLDVPLADRSQQEYSAEMKHILCNTNHTTMTSLTIKSSLLPRNSNFTFKDNLH